MNYSFHRIKMRIKNKGLVYLILALLIAVGIGLMTYSLNEYFLYYDDFASYKEDVGNHPAFITPYSEESGMIDARGFTYEDYLSCREEFKKEIDVRYLVTVSTLLFLDKEDVSDFRIFLMGEEQFEELFHFKREEQTAYVGFLAGQKIEKMKGRTSRHISQGKPDEDYFSSINHLYLANKQDAFVFENLSYTVQELSDENEKTKIYQDAWDLKSPDEIKDLDDAVILPLEDFEKIKDGEDLYKEEDLSVTITLSDNPDSGRDILDFSQFMTERHKGKFYYKVDEEALNAKRLFDERTSLVKTYFFMALFQLLLVSISSAGIFYIILNSRKKDIAISMAYGSSFKTQKKELILEIIFVVLSGALLGLLAYFVYDIGVLKELFIDGRTLVALIVIVLFMIGCNTFLLLNRLSKMSTIDILSDL